MVRPAQPPSPAAGFTLVELLLIGAVMAALLGGGAASLLRHQRASHAALLSLHNSAELLRARQQLQQEIGLAERLADGAPELPAGCPALANPLVLIGAGNSWRIAYGLRRQGPDADWRGPAQLLRCGPPYGPTGLNPAAAPLHSVLLDRLNTEDREDRLLVRLAEVPDSLLVTLLTTEDRDFYQHGGVSPVAIIRAMAANLLAGRTVRPPVFVAWRFGVRTRGTVTADRPAVIA